MHRNAVAVTEAARALGLEIHIREFPEGTRTAADAAAAVGVKIAQIAKSLIFAVGDPAGSAGSGEDGPGSSGEVVLAFVSGDNQLDEALLADAAGQPAAWRVDAARVRAATGFPVGGVPPFGHPAPLRAFIDEDLLLHDEIWAAGGTPHHVFPIAPAELVRRTGADAVALARR